MTAALDVAAIRAQFPALAVKDGGRDRIYFDNPAGTGTGDRRTLAEWGFTLDLEEVNWARGELVLTLASGTAFLSDPLFGFEDKLVVWRDGVRRWQDLPVNARAYVERVAQLVGAEVSMVSIGPGHDQIIEVLPVL